MSPLHPSRPPRQSVVPVPAEEIVCRLETLAATLTARRWTAYVTAQIWRTPRLLVQHRTDPSVRTHIQAAPDDTTGAWLFWDDDGTPIAPADAPDHAADVIIRIMTGRGEPGGGVAAEKAMPMRAGAARRGTSRQAR